MLRTLFLLFCCTGPAFAADDCAERAILVAKVDVNHAKQTWHDAHGRYFDTDWKAKLAVADDRDQVLEQRRAARSDLLGARDEVHLAREQLRQTRKQAHDATLVCTPTETSNQG